jgi:hypothetical protein
VRAAPWEEHSTTAIREQRKAALVKERLNLKEAVRRLQHSQTERVLVTMQWWTAYPAVQDRARDVRNWNSKWCYQAVWLRSDSRTCTLSLFLF